MIAFVVGQSGASEGSGYVPDLSALRALEAGGVHALRERQQRRMRTHGLGQPPARQPRRDHREHVTEHQRVQLRRPTGFMINIMGQPLN